LIPVNATTIEPTQTSTALVGAGIAPDELEAVLVAIDDRLDVEADVDRIAVLRRGRARVEMTLADMLAG
jgi:hypothetical protein